MLEGELTLASVARIGFAENSVSVSGHNLSRLECLPDEVLDFAFVRHGVAELALHLLQPNEHLLVSQSVQWTSKAVHASCERQVRIRECGADEMDSMSADVAAFVITGSRFKLSTFLLIICKPKVYLWMVR